MDDIEFKLTVIKKLEHIETKLENYSDLEKNTDEALLLSKQNYKDIEEIKNKNKWYFTTIVGTVIVFIIHTILNFVKKV